MQVREDLEAPYAALLETARRVGKAANEAGLAVDAPEYAASFRPDLMELLSAWAGGAKFADLLRLTDIFEVGRVVCHAWIVLAMAVSHSFCSRHGTSDASYARV